jgi:hypothetical protein
MTEQDTTLSDRLEQARERSNELAATATSRTREFVHDHPVASVAGGIVVGALIAGLLSRRKPVTPTKAVEAMTDAAAARLTKIGAIAAELALAYAARAASVSKDSVGQISDAGTEAGHKVTELADIALHTLRTAGETVIHRLTHRDTK